MSAAPSQPPTPRAPKASFASRLFGYDVFISFALGAPPRGTQSYASDLARRLRERDLSVFFSEDEAAPGEPLSGTLESALRRAKLLVVVVNRGTLQVPNWVRTEVETFRARCPGRPVIPVCLDGSLRDPSLSDAVQPWLQHAQNIWLDERAEDAAQGLASEALVARLLGAPRRLRAHALWRALVVAVGLGLATLTVLAGWQALVATRERDRATALREQGLSRQLAAQSAASRVSDPVRALLLAAQSQAVVRSTASDGSLLGALAALTQPQPIVRSTAADDALLGALAALPLSRLQQHGAAFQTLALQPHGDALLLADVRGAVLRGEIGKPALDTVVPPATGLNLYNAVHAIAFAPDGRSWAHAGSSREITVHTGTATRALPDGDKIGETTVIYVFGLAFSPDGASLAAASSSGALRLHDLGSGTARLLHAAPVDLAAVAFSPDGRWLAAGGDRGFVRAFAVAPAASAPELQAEPIGTVQALAFDAAGERLFVASRGGRIDVLAARDGRRLARLDAPEQGALETMAVAPDGRFIASGHGSGAVLLWSWSGDAQARAAPQVLLRHAAAVRGLAFAADGRTLVSAGEDGRLFVSLPVDVGRWLRRPAAVRGAATLPPPPGPSAPGAAASPTTSGSAVPGAATLPPSGPPVPGATASPTTSAGMAARPATVVSAAPGVATLPPPSGPPVPGAAASPTTSAATAPGVAAPPPILGSSAPGAAPPLQASTPAEATSPDGRWIAWPGTLAEKPSPFAVDFSRLSAVQLPRLTVLRGADRQPVVDGAELPAAPGERIVAGPVFAADSSQLALQVGARLLFWDLAAAEALDAALPLPPGARLSAASADAPGWLAAGAKPGEALFFGTDRAGWQHAACALADRTLTRDEWRRHVGDDRPYAPACAPR